MKEKPQIALSQKIFNICNGMPYEDGIVGPVAYDTWGLNFLEINQTETGRFNLNLMKVNPNNEQSTNNFLVATILPEKVEFNDDFKIKEKGVTNRLKRVLMMVEHVRDNQI